MELNIIIINALAHVLYDYKQGRPGTINQSCIRLSLIPHDLCLYIYVNNVNQMTNSWDSLSFPWGYLLAETSS